LKVGLQLQLRTELWPVNHAYAYLMQCSICGVEPEPSLEQVHALGDIALLALPQPPGKVHISVSPTTATSQV
jgi:hypothetical protein